MDQCLRFLVFSGSLNNVWGAFDLFKLQGCYRVNPVAIDYADSVSVFVFVCVCGWEGRWWHLFCFCNSQKNKQKKKPKLCRLPFVMSGAAS